MPLPGSGLGLHRQGDVRACLPEMPLPECWSGLRPLRVTGDHLTLADAHTRRHGVGCVVVPRRDLRLFDVPPVPADRRNSMGNRVACWRTSKRGMSRPGSGRRCRRPRPWQHRRCRASAMATLLPEVVGMRMASSTLHSNRTPVYTMRHTVV